MIDRPEWQSLKMHHQEIASIPIKAHFLANPEREQVFSASAAGLSIDFSRHALTSKTLTLLVQLAVAVGLKQKIQALFSGQAINSTEQRSALHTALRQLEQNQSNTLPSQPEILKTVKRNLDAMTQVVHQVHHGLWRGFSGKPITNIVNIGVGGSGLGPRMSIQALANYQSNTALQHYFIANMDPADALQTLAPLNQETTLFLIVSKSFKTKETLLNAKLAKAWLQQHPSCHKQTQLKNHFISITNFPEIAASFEVESAKILVIPEWVGGRYSLWSVAGLALALALGMDHFKAFLRGAQTMDQHFYQAPFHKNLPVLLALIGLWYINFFHANTLAILPYHHRLQDLPTYLQQLEMESNGKSIRHNGQTVSYATGPIIWGSVGSNCQHAFHQCLLQGTHLTPVDLILGLQPDLVPTLSPQFNQMFAAQHAALVATALKQSDRLVDKPICRDSSQQLNWPMIGGAKPILQDLNVDARLVQNNKLAPFSAHQTIYGKSPNNLITFNKLTPVILGALIAMYEHKVFVQGSLWDINPFDQWGVELEKKASTSI